MASAPSDHDQLVSEFVGVTGASAEDAAGYLASSSWDLQSAITEYYNPDTEEHDEEADPSTAAPESSSATANPQQTSNPATKKKFATLGDLRSGGAGGGPDQGPDGDDSDDGDDNQNLFTGGEKSGLAVENPDDLKKKIIERARKNLPRPGGDDARPPKSHFTGNARTLGGEDAPSRVIEDLNARPPPREPVERHLHFWEDGFSVDDGPLYRLDDPVNAAVLAQIKSGRAPLSILNVQPGSEVDVKLVQHAEKYVAPKKKYKPFEGSGQRLGSPTPGVADHAAPQESNSVPVTTASPASSSQANTIQVNESNPVVSLQIRLGDGTRLVSRFNTNHTLGDVYEFVNSASPSSRARSWVLMTTFPSKELTDKSQELGAMSEFKRGGTAVQKWA